MILGYGIEWVYLSDTEAKLYIGIYLTCIM